MSFDRLSERYKELHAAGLTKKEAHAAAFQEMITPPPEPEPPVNPITRVLIGR